MPLKPCKSEWSEIALYLVFVFCWWFFWRIGISWDSSLCNHHQFGRINICYLFPSILINPSSCWRCFFLIDRSTDRVLYFNAITTIWGPNMFGFTFPIRVESRTSKIQVLKGSLLLTFQWPPHATFCVKGNPEIPAASSSDPLSHRIHGTNCIFLYIYHENQPTCRLNISFVAWIRHGCWNGMHLNLSQYFFQQIEVEELHPTSQQIEGMLFWLWVGSTLRILTTDGTT